ncbi:MAG: tRNA preQ1(34) S-adenosylmethionine ribosyltransferase-isomerase QueA [Planctomycetaceae bacterium]|nr:tRNA preQ1(34) S-adenosylmethionine ribosyltransferase-isomerase QueA [Planctomycetaceae bacterium]
MDRLSDYDYSLPPGLIATAPPAEREAARLLVVHRRSQRWEHATIRDLPQFLRPGDCLVLNDTRVLPARLRGLREATGGKWEGLYLSSRKDGCWRLLSHSRGRLLDREFVDVTHASDPSHRLRLQLIEREADGVFVFRPESERSFLDLLDEFGTVPLPPYIGRDEPTAADRERYQTMFAREPGSVAAPTAGLHFTPELFARCADQGVQRATVTLHVGVGTFRPVNVENLADHHMHSEWCTVPEVTVRQIDATRSAGGRVVAVGTTTVRTLESAAREGSLRPWQGETNIFIRPPWTFRTIDALLTNFHLPKSTLLILISALAGRDLILAAYQAAIEARYRFFSYGDAMLIL